MMKVKTRFYKRPKLKNPILIAAWPGMGEVALKVANYLREKLAAEEFGYIEADEFFYHTNVLIKNKTINIPKLPSGKFFYVKNKQGLQDFVIFISEAQPDLTKSQNYCDIILGAASQLNIKKIFCFAAMPMPIDYTQDSKVWACATSEELLNTLKSSHAKALKEGQISGMNGLFLGIAKQKGFKGICLLGEIPIYTVQMENPKASLAILRVLSNILDIKIDFSQLTEQSKRIEVEIAKLIDYLKGQEFPDAAIKEEDVDFFKKMLATYTKLPESARYNIERLFKEARGDLKKAAELKGELDKWNVYKDFEDRFLDLFKRQKKVN